MKDKNRMIPDKFIPIIEAEAKTKNLDISHQSNIWIDRITPFIAGSKFTWPLAQSYGEEIGEARMAKKMIEFLNSKECEQIGIKYTSEGKHWAKIIEKHFADILKKAEGK